MQSSIAKNGAAAEYRTELSHFANRMVSVMRSGSLVEELLDRAPGGLLGKIVLVSSRGRADLARPKDLLCFQHAQTADPSFRSG
jgi:hypothetical protein